MESSGTEAGRKRRGTPFPRCDEAVGCGREGNGDGMKAASVVGGMGWAHSSDGHEAGVGMNSVNDSQGQCWSAVVPVWKGGLTLG